ncbi:MAG: VWA domain-containing protein, partial [Erysipelotrichaceae bacterium]|nr:VWA domain-containing protein [Erysipelotrichaceae bacterium]
MKKLLILLMAMFMMFMTVNADDTPAPNYDPSWIEIDGSKTASPSALSVKKRNTTVTLSLPSAEYQNEIDLVFVADTSSSTTNNDINFGEYIDDLFNTVKEMNPNIKFNVGVIKFTGLASDGLNIVSKNKYSGLTEYSSDLKGVFELAINAPSKKDYRKKPQNYPDYTEDICMPGGGSGLECGLQLADEWLTADKDLDDNNKYVVVLTDGKSYIWNNKAGEPTSYYTQYYTGIGSTANSKPAIGQSTGSANKQNGYNAAVPSLVSSYYLYGYTTQSAEYHKSKYYQELYDRNDAELSNTETAYDLYCEYAFEGSSTMAGSLETFNTTNGAEVFTKNSYATYRKYYKFTPTEELHHGKAINYFKMNPYAVIENEDGTYTWDTNTLNEEFYMFHAD